jgi:dolichol-phosphate mannosyltransferase
MAGKIVVVAPTFNEEESIGSFIAEVLAQDVEVLISDSHSGDQTAKIVAELAANDKRIHYLDVKERGLGLGLSKGLDYATEKLGADILITMEADLSNDPKQLPEFVAKLKKADIVVGSRYIRGGRITNWSWWRKAFSLGANYILRVLAWAPKLHEFTNLYRAFTKEAWVELRPKVKIYTDWIFVPAFAFEALDSGFKMAEQPIVYFDRFGGRSKMQTLSYTKNLLRYALRYRLKKLCPTS